MCAIVAATAVVPDYQLNIIFKHIEINTPWNVIQLFDMPCNIKRTNELRKQRRLLCNRFEKFLHFHFISSWVAFATTIMKMTMRQWPSNAKRGAEREKRAADEINQKWKLNNTIAPIKWTNLTIALVLCTRNTSNEFEAIIWWWQRCQQRWHERKKF